MQKEEQDKQNLDSLMCPSFNCYFTDQDLNKIQNDDAFAFSASQNDDTDFAFAALMDEALYNDADADAVFPLFEGRRNSVASGRDDSSSAVVLRFPIAGDEHEHSAAAESDSSSSEADELEGIPAGTYCVWKPNSPQASPAKCKKSNSTGSSSSSSAKKWKLLDLLRRSNSEGKESFLFLTTEKKKVNERWSIEVSGKSKEKKVAQSAHEALYVRNRELRMVDKRKSFLPYKPLLLGFSTSRLAKPFLPK